MAKVEMQKINIYALRKYRKKLLELLQRRGVVEISQLDKDEIQGKVDTSVAISKFDRGIVTTQKALDIVNEYNPKKSSMLDNLKGLYELPMEKFKDFIAVYNSIYNQATNIVNLQSQIDDCNNEISRLNTKISALQPWLNLDISMRFKGTKSTKTFIGTLPRDITHRELKKILVEKAPDITALHTEVVSHTNEMSCIFAVCMQKDAIEVENLLRSIGFSYPSAPSKISPAEYTADLQGRIEKQYEIIESLKSQIFEIINSKKFLPEYRIDQKFEFIIDFFAMRKEKYQVISNLSHTKSTFIITGYIPKSMIIPISTEIDKKCNAVLEEVELKKDEELPVMLHNSEFTSPVEGVLEMYSMPSKRDIDPTSIMSIFYYVLFGLMLSDFAYGLIMFIGCLIVVKKFPKMDKGLSQTLKMFMYCGLTTAFWGLMFGSCFGDAITVISKTFFDTQVDFPVLWFVPLNQPMRMLMFSFGVGLLHIFTGLFINLYIKIKEKDVQGAIFDVGFWITLVSSLILWLMTTDMMAQMSGISLALPPIIVTICQIIAVISAVGIIATSGRSSKNPVKRVLKGCYGLYDITSYLSDILSYSRLLALGLATSVISSVFNTMAAMGGKSVFGVIIFIVVFIVGHIFNLAINLLGAYVHTNRLQYVEFFGKFYEGGGEKFNPFSLHTKYYNIREDKKNG